MATPFNNNNEGTKTKIHWQTISENTMVKDITEGISDINKLPNHAEINGNITINPTSNDNNNISNLKKALSSKIKDNIGNSIKKLNAIAQDFIIGVINKIIYIHKHANGNDNDINTRSYLNKAVPKKDEYQVILEPYDTDHDKHLNVCKEKLYHGINDKRVLNQRNEIFYAPLSLTTKCRSACVFAGTGMILQYESKYPKKGYCIAFYAPFISSYPEEKERLLGFMNPGINKIPLLVYNNDANNIEWQLKIHLFVINIFKVDDSNITLTFYYYDYNDKDPTKPWELYSFDESKLDEIKYKCIHQDIQGFDPSYKTPLNSKSNTIGHKVTILTIDTSCFINFLKNDQNNSNNNNNTNYNNTYDERKSNTFDDNTASSINLDGALPYSKKNDISLNRNYNVTINIKEYFMKNNIFDDSNMTLTFYYYVYIDNNLTKIWELSVNLLIKSKTFYSSKIIVIKIVLYISYTITFRIE